MRKALTISAIAHATLLLWGMVTFVVKPLEANPAESLPIDIISDSEFSQITAGVKTAKQVETPKPMVEKLGEAKPVEELTPKVEKKPAIQTASAEPMPVPEPRKPDPKPEKAKAEPEKPKAEPDKAKAAEPPPPDPIAEALKKADEQKKKDEQKKAEEQKKKLEEQKKKKAEEQKRKEEALKNQPAFDPSKIAALLDRRAPQRQAALGDTLNQTASLGLPTGRSATLSQSELDALRAQIQANWNVPAGALEAKDLVVVVRIMFRQDGTLSADPTVMNRSGHPYFQVFAESALRAIRRGQPYRLPVAKYDVWKDVEVTFDPRDMFRG